MTAPVPHVSSSSLEHTDDRPSASGAMKAALLLGATGLASAASAATITVNSTADNTIAGDGHCTLREALNNLNGHSDSTHGDCAAPSGTNDVIDLTGVAGVISLNGTQLHIVESVVINGPGAGSLTVDANNFSRAFYIAKPGSDNTITIDSLSIAHGWVAPGKAGSAIDNVGQTVTLSNVTITGSKPESGVVASSGGALTLSNSSITGNTGGTTGGGAISSSNGTLSITSSTITGNVGHDGGGIESNGDKSITITDSLISGNTGLVHGGGLDIIGLKGSATLSHSIVSSNTAGSGAGMALRNPAATVDIADSTINNNIASYAGGGIFFYHSTAAGKLTLERTTVSANQASGTHDGGGLFLYRTNSDMLVQNSTIAGNKAGRSGGGLFLKGPFGGSQHIDIVSATIASNTAATSGGNIDGGSSANDIDVADSIIAGGSAAAGPDIASHSADILVNYSLIQNDTGATLDGASTHNLLNVDPQLSSLAANGGATDTMALASTSPAIDAGHNDAALTTDQRGVAYPRPAFAAADMGAFEYQGPTTPAPTSGIFNVPPYETRFLRGAGTVTMADTGKLYLISSDSIVGSQVQLPEAGRATVIPSFNSGSNTLTFSNVGSNTQFTVSAVDAITFTGGSAAVNVAGKSKGLLSFTAYAGDTIQFSQDGTLQYVKVADAQVGGVVSNSVAGLSVVTPTLKLAGTTPHLGGGRLDTSVFAALATALGVTATNTSIDAQGTLLLTTANGSYAYAPTSLVVSPTTAASGLLDSGDLQLRVGPLLVGLVPAVTDPANLIGSLQSITGQNTIVQRFADGRLQLQPKGLLFIGLPAAISASSQPAGLSANGRYADLTSSTGQSQRIYSAFYDPTQLTAALLAADPAATIKMQADGTAAVTMGGQSVLFVPGWQLLPTPYAHFHDSYWVQDGNICIAYSNFYYQSFSIATAPAAH